jgi:hypothetical protein
VAEKQPQVLTRLRERITAHGVNPQIDALEAAIEQIQGKSASDALPELTHLTFVTEKAKTAVATANPELVTAQNLQSLYDGVTSMLQAVQAQTAQADAGAAVDWTAIPSDAVLDALTAWPPAIEVGPMRDLSMEFDSLQAQAAALLGGVQSNAAAKSSAMEVKLTELEQRLNTASAELAARNDELGHQDRCTGRVNHSATSPARRCNHKSG